MNTSKVRFSRILSSIFGRRQKFFILAQVLVIIPLIPMIAFGASVDLAWDANTESDLAGYKIYYGTTSGIYPNSIDVGNTTQYTLANLDEGVTYYLAATAYDVDNNESDFSEELVHTFSYSKPKPPGSSPTTPSIPAGPSIGQISQSYNFSTAASDPDGDELQYRYDWGDGDLSAWGDSSQDHSWSDAGVFCVKAAAIDSTGAMSAWSDCRNISVYDGISSGQIGITDLSPGNYEAYFINVGDNHYIDRNYTITSMPSELEGLSAVRTANDDKNSSAEILLTFDVDEDLTLYVGYDSRTTTYPEWLTTAFSNTGMTIDTTDTPLTVWQKEFSAGTISLPGNKFGNPINANSNYIVLLAPYSAPAPVAEITHVISVTAGAHGSISPSGSVTVKHGSSQIFAISAAPNYHIHDVFVNGISVGAVSTFSFDNVIQDHTVSASFVLDNQSPISDAGPDQTLNEGIVVRLNGSNSSDPGGNIVAYSWAQTSGTPVHLSNSDQIVANFTSPNVTSLGDTLTFQLVVTDNEGLQAIDSCSVYVTRDEVSDIDGDGVPDEQDDLPYDSDEYLDTDGDGEGNNSDTDDDNDGMTDTWELVYGLDPLEDDAAEDPDGDENSNINEYNQGTDPNYNENNFEPDSPQLLGPVDHEVVGLTPLLETDEFNDPDLDDVHSQTQWKIIRVVDEFCVMDVTTFSSLTSLEVPRLILQEDTDYIWQVKFIDNHGGASAWSKPGNFTTEFLEQDSDGNGILDHQEVDTTIDLDGDGVMDLDQTDIMSVATETGEYIVGVSIRDAENVDSIISIQSETPEDPDLMPASEDAPNFLAFGLIHFKLLVNDPGDEVVVTIYLSKPAYDDGIWYKYNPVNGEWLDYSEYTEFSADRKMVYLTLKDGGLGDADGIENGIIVDPLALRTVTDHSSGGSDFFVADIAETLDPTGTCFIAAADRKSASGRREIGVRELSIVLILMMLAYLGKEISLRIKQYWRIGRKTSLMEGWRNSQDQAYRKR